MTPSTFRCFNCNQRHDLETVVNLGGDLYCQRCAKCYCGAPATTIVDGSISCGLCPGSRNELGKPTGMIVYVGEGAYGKIPAATWPEIRQRFFAWPTKPRLYQEHENGRVDITREVWA